MRVYIFAKRNFTEILRDPLSLIFGAGLPIALMILFCILSKSVPGMPQIFAVRSLGLSMAYFGLTFLTLFTGMLLANDRDKAFLTRLRATPLRQSECLLGYLLPMLPVAIIQIALCFLVAFAVGFPVSFRVIPAIAALLCNALFFISLGLLFGTLFSATQVGGISSILVNAAAIFSGIWFPLEQMQGGFRKFCDALPFMHGLSLVKQAYAGTGGTMLADAAYLLLCAVVFFTLAAVLMRKKAEC